MLSTKAKKYLKEVFGYNNIKEVDKETIKCIEENLLYENYLDEFSLDREILKEYGLNK